LGKHEREGENVVRIRYLTRKKCKRKKKRVEKAHEKQGCFTYHK